MTAGEARQAEAVFGATLQAHRSAGEAIELLKRRIGGRLRGERVILDAHLLGNSSKPPAQWTGGQPSGLLVVRLAPARVHLAFFPAYGGELPEPPCPECLNGRLKSVLTPHEQEALRHGAPVEGEGAPYLLDTVADNIAVLASRLVKEPRTAEDGARIVFTLNLVSQEIAASPFLPDAFCRTCLREEDSSVKPAPLELRETLQARSGKGRMKSLAEYEFPLRAMINPVCGAAGTFMSPGLAQSVTAPVFGGYVQRSHTCVPRTVSWSGLCTRASDSRIAGMLESLERQAGMFSPVERTAVSDCYANLHEQAMDPALCLAYADECFVLPLGLTKYASTLRLDWVWGTSLRSQRPILVPRQLVFYDYNMADQPHVVDNNSSGCALGSCYEEAILKALFELIERDSFVITWTRKLALPRINPDSCSDQKARFLLDRVRHLGYDMFLLDGRLDLAIPSVIAIGRRRDRELGSLVVGAAASTDCEEAVRSALYEAATSIVEAQGMVKASEKHLRELAENFGRVITVADHSHLYGLPHMADRIQWLYGNPQVRSTEEAFPREGRWYSQGNIGEDLSYCLAALERRGLQEVVVVDMTTREQRQLDLKTVRVIVPGLAPIDFGHPRNRAAGLPRLFSAPAHAGLRPVDNSDALNPLPHPFP